MTERSEPTESDWEAGSRCVAGLGLGPNLHWLVRRILENEIVLLRRPPWRCPRCGQHAVNKFEWQALADGDCFRCTCGSCGHVSLV